MSTRVKRERDPSEGFVCEVEPRILRIVNYKVEPKILPKEFGRKEWIKGKKETSMSAPTVGSGDIGRKNVPS